MHNGIEEDWVNATPTQRLSWYYRMGNMQHRRIIEKSVSVLEVFPAQHRFLATIENKPMCSQKELAELMRVSTAAVAVSIKKLEKNGYISRVMSEEDNRVNQLEITEKGKEMMRQGFEIFNRVDEEMLKNFTPEEVEEFSGYLKKLYDNLLSM